MQPYTTLSVAAVFSPHSKEKCRTTLSNTAPLLKPKLVCSKRKARTRRFSSAGGVAGASLHGAQGGPSASSQFYTAETLAIAVTTSIVSSLVVGFISGYIFSRRCRGDEEADDACPADDYSHYLDRGGGGDPHAEGFLAAAHHHHHNNAKPINLVLNVPPKNGKNANSSADNKPLQKVKKIYL